MNDHERTNPVVSPDSVNTEPKQVGNRKSSSLSKPRLGEKISRGTLAYFSMRARLRAYSLMVREFKKSGLSVDDLASRLGVLPDLIKMRLAGPWGLDINIVAEMVFATSGAMLVFGIEELPDAKPPMTVTDGNPRSVIADSSNPESK